MQEGVSDNQNNKEIYFQTNEDLFDVLSSYPKSEWQEQLVNVPVNDKFEYGSNPSSVTNGEFIVYSRFIKEENRTFLYIYSKRYAKDLWATNTFEFPKGKVGFYCRMKYIRNIFLIFVLLKEENKLCLYSVHSNNPERGWKKNLNLNYSNNNFESYSLFMCDFNYIKNLYVVSFNTSNTNLEHYNSYIAYKFFCHPHTSFHSWYCQRHN